MIGDLMVIKVKSSEGSFPKEMDQSVYLLAFKDSMVGQIIIGEDLCIKAVNNRMFDYFQLAPCEIEGLSICRAFHCSAFRQRQCGINFLDHCKTCSIRCAVQDILGKNVLIKDSIVQFFYREKNRKKAKWFQLSGGPICHMDKTYALLAITDITELKMQENQLRTALALDLATGTLNKYGLMESLQKMIEPGSGSSWFTICMIDFDNFKEINDAYGHLMGDQVLEVFSDIAKKHIRKKDILGRYGGEEFVFAFRDSDEESSLKILQRIQQKLKEFFNKKMKIQVSFSAGLVYIDGKVSQFVQSSDLIGAVDKRLYCAKRQGRNRAVYSKGEVVFNS